MLDVILRDVDPDKATNVTRYLKEMNDLVFLITIGKGPFVAKSMVNNSSDLLLKGEVIENNFTAKFSAEIAHDSIKSAHFQLFEDAKQVISISHSVKKGEPIMMRVVLNSDGEIMGRNELEKGFKRQISHQATGWMSDDQDINTEAVLASQIDESNDLSNVKQGNIEGQNYADQSEGFNEELKDSKMEMSREIDMLSARVIKAMQEAEEMIGLLNEMSYDFTRGSAPNITMMKIEEQVLENGAKVELIDAVENGYSITFRKGSLDDMTEVSFFLENEESLIFSVYFSSLGNAKISAAGKHAEHVINRLANYIS